MFGIFQGGRAEQITETCDLTRAERKVAREKARELDEMMKWATVVELFGARTRIANRMHGAPGGVTQWARRMVQLLDQEIVLRAEYELSPQRRQILRESVKDMVPSARQQALLWTQQKQRIVSGRDPVIDKELAEDARVLAAGVA